jgi:hypothetical protein
MAIASNSGREGEKAGGLALRRPPALLMKTTLEIPALRVGVLCALSGRKLGSFPD